MRNETTQSANKNDKKRKKNFVNDTKITLTQQQPSFAANNAPSKRSLEQWAKREKERQITMMDDTINNTYNNTNVGINEENSFTVATLKRALAQRTHQHNNIHECQDARNEAILPHASPMNDVNNLWNTLQFHNNLENAGENSDNCGVAPSEILGIDETTNTATRLRNHSFETGESSRGPIDIVNGPPQEPFMDEHFFNDDNMDLDFEFNNDPLIHETQHYFGKYGYRMSFVPRIVLA
ncbi:hypothetical protein GIB67_008099 [Kingdonia uniflora]|uniref:Uncharacterized protein n=1 Tax=Kingdonia uniflora TaxID=39325 RepID=A0A7J7MCU1_9MAGN|nr:hypothetical protein GIB67_008099 [Kingdonia uniflora]